MEGGYQIKYNSGKTKIYLLAGVCILSLLFLMAIPAITALFIFTFIIAGFGFFMSLAAFKSIVLYDDRIEVVNMFGGIQMEIDFDEIKRVGFLHGQESYTRYNNGEDMSSYILVFLLTNNDTMQLDGNDFDDIHKVCAYIQEKIGETS